MRSTMQQATEPETMDGAKEHRMSPTTTTAQQAGRRDADAREHQKSGHSSYARILPAFRLQFVVPQLIWVPAIVLAASWGLAVGIGLWISALVDDRVPVEEPIYTGAAQAVLWCLVFMAAYSGTHTFPFALALSYSRRVYLIGALLAFLAVSLGYGVAAAGGAALEEATDGFGAHVYVFALPYLLTDGFIALGAMATTASMLVMLAGFGAAMLYKRFSVTVTWTVIIGLVAVLAVAAMLLWQADAWPTVWQWMTEQTPWRIAGWLVTPVVALALVDYWLIRRATP
ncbi:hypothetical protein [Nesterenkonia sp. K-15-9-6]|uniref:hypothetical protein n=1 Tax=Nesterenkonia sp. K-15-9-6 TaxID=3093918 RepID=UPI0040441DF6